MSSAFRVEALAPPNAAANVLDARLVAWAALFDAASSGCFCRYWHFKDTKNDWLDRCANSPTVNRDEHAAAVRANDPAARGLVAWSDAGDVIGWMKLTPRAAVPKLRGLPVYRALDLGDDAGVYAIGCFLVHPDFRERGVARALVGAAESHVRAWGGHAIEAYPRHTSEPMHAEQAWMGPESAFLEAGFSAVAGEGQYPVYRKIVTQGEP